MSTTFDVSNREHSIAFNAAQIAAMTDSTQMKASEAIALAAIAIADVEALDGLVWDDDGFYATTDFVAREIESPSSGMPISTFASKTALRHMVKASL